MSDTRRCPKCEGLMSTGFILDEGYGSVQVSKWQDGEPKKSVWLMGSVRRAGAARHEITTYRCDRCGYLESYAV